MTSVAEVLGKSLQHMTKAHHTTELVVIVMYVAIYVCVVIGIIFLGDMEVTLI